MNTTYLYIDPLTARIVYLTEGSEFPTKSMVIDQGKLRLFAPNSLVKVNFEGALPAGLNAQSCWHFAVQQSDTKAFTISRLEASVDASAFAPAGNAVAKPAVNASASAA